MLNMEEVQIWQYEGLGVDKDTLGRVLRIFKSDGIHDIKSQQALKEYIEKLDDSKLREMCEIDVETALQIFAGCFGISSVAMKYSRWQNEDMKTAINILQKEKETAEQEAEANRTELLKVRQKLNEEIDSLRHEYSIKNYEKEEAEQRIKELQDTLAHYKTDLYDFYAQAGSVPNYG